MSSQTTCRYPHIQHLVLAGGGPSIFQTMGALRHLHANGFVQKDSIQGIYGTSAGSVVGVLMCLNMEWKDITEYFVGRPWHSTFLITPTMILDAYAKKGVFDKDFLIKVFQPIFAAKDISADITLQELYDLSHIDLHIYSFELHAFQTIDFSHTTHPEMSVVEAIYRSCALPIVFSPHCDGETCYLDGGLMTNYPVNCCIENGGDPSTILGMCNSYRDYDEEHSTALHVTSESTILDYMSTLMSKIVRHVNTDRAQTTLDYEVEFQSHRMSLTYMSQVLSSKELRAELLDKGVAAAQKFMTQCIHKEDDLVRRAEQEETLAMSMEDKRICAS